MWRGKGFMKRSILNRLSGRDFRNHVAGLERERDALDGGVSAVAISGTMWRAEPAPCLERPKRLSGRDFRNHVADDWIHHWI